MRISLDITGWNALDAISTERNLYSLDSASECRSNSAYQADCNYQWNAGTYRGDLWAANKLTKLMDTNVITGDQRNLL